MITIDNTVYRAVAAELISRIQDADFFNGTVKYDTEEFHSLLRCTLVLYRDPVDRRLVAAVPVWWEYHLYQAHGEIPTDFSWGEFSSFFEGYF